MCTGMLLHSVYFSVDLIYFQILAVDESLCFGLTCKLHKTNQIFLQSRSTKLKFPIFCQRWEGLSNFFKKCLTKILANNQIWNLCLILIGYKKHFWKKCNMTYCLKYQGCDVTKKLDSSFMHRLYVTLVKDLYSVIRVPCIGGQLWLSAVKINQITEMIKATDAWIVFKWGK